MEINEVFESYKGSVQEENRNLMTIACDEMQSKQYEEAAAHFGQLYEKAPNDYMAFFFRAYNKNHCGIKLNVMANAERLTSAFQLACQKAVGDRYRFRDNMFLLMHYYDEGMIFLENAAVSFESETKRQIKEQRINTLIDVAETYHDSISTEVELESYVVNYLKEFDRLEWFDLEKLILSYDPSYAETIKKKKRTTKIILCVGVIAWAVIIAVIAIVASLR